MFIYLLTSSLLPKCIFLIFHLNNKVFTIEHAVLELTEDVLDDWRHEEGGGDEGGGEDHEGQGAGGHDRSRRLPLLSLDVALEVGWLLVCSSYCLHNAILQLGFGCNLQQLI